MTGIRDLPGIGTLFASPHGRIEDLLPGDFAFFGVPFDLSAPGIFGARHGPSACREHSAYYAGFRPGFEEVTTARALEFPEALDLGDAPIWPLDWSATTTILREYIGAVLAAGARPVAIGGDHAVTAPLVAGFAEVVRARGGSPAYVQLSRRLDLGVEHPVYGDCWRGGTVRAIIDGGLPVEKIAWLGTNGYLPGAEWDDASAHGLAVLTLADVRREGVAAAVHRAIAATGSAPADVYVSIDLDVLDGGYVPNTDEPTFDGMTNVELLAAVDVINGLNVGAVDVTGLNPHVEPASITGARFVAWLILRLVCTQRPLPGVSSDDDIEEFPRPLDLLPPPTFLDAPIGDFDAIAPGTVVVSGAPYVARDRGIQGGGPRGIRAASRPLASRVVDTTPDGTFDYLTGRTWRTTGTTRMVDIGDLNIYPSDVMRSTEGIAGGVAEVVRRGGFSVCLGGDHYVGYPSCLGFSRALAETRPNARIGYIHIDGHLDFTDEYPANGKYNNGTNARRISELPNVNPRNMSWIGIQGPCGHEPMSVIRKYGAKVFTSEHIHAEGPVAVARQAAEHAMDGTDYVYMSFDIDVVDAGFSNGTGSVTMGAVTPLQLLQMLDVLAEYPIAAMDLVENSPDLDPSSRTCILAAESLVRLLAPKLYLID